MEIVLKNLKIIEPGSSLNGRKRDIRIKDGRIVKIAAEIEVPRSVPVRDFKGARVSPGWVDVGAYSGEPGYEERETLEHLARAAATGGYTTVCIMPLTKPVLQSKSEIRFILDRSRDLAVDLLPIGAVSKDLAAIEMAEMYLMKEAGAVAFSDADKGIQKSGLLLRALDYLRYHPDTLLIQQSYDGELSGSGQMHEGRYSTLLGLRGIPSMAEIAGIQRDLEILKYTGSGMLIHKLSTAEGLALIRNARKSNSRLFASVSVFNLAFEDKDLETFDANLKLFPPLRSAADRSALLKGLKDGSIDLIVSDHQPINPERKDLEFQAAGFGAISLETAYSLMRTSLPDELGDELWVEKVAINPRKILGLNSDGISEGAEADLTLFDPGLSWTYRNENVRSLSRNSPLLGRNLVGKALGIVKKDQLITPQN